MTRNSSSDFDIVCPKCLFQNSFSTNLSQSWHELTCLKCRSGFRIRFARIRSKNSRHITKARQRLFKIRTRDFPEGESYIEFYAKGDEDFELRQRDLASFQYFNDKIVIVQNFTTNKYLDLSRAKVWGTIPEQMKAASYQPAGVADSYQESLKTKAAYQTGCSTLCIMMAIIILVIAMVHLI